MPHEPNDRFQQDAERGWQDIADAGRFPAQRAYRGVRHRAASWTERNTQPTSAWHGLTTG
ncbi:DNA repair protein [Micromonospora sp. DT31]|uniref:DNA repair protein n=1 Tax=Micromonospora sp. DT31 TaxID=3393434 RepID=UPI003CF4C66F